MGSPPTSGAIKMIHKNQSFKELLSQPPVQKGRAKAIQPRIEEHQTKAPQSLIFLQKHCRKRHLTPQRQTYSRPEKSVRCQKTAQKL
jgi:predicted SprT family Zn-dependent metalloprotease